MGMRVALQQGLKVSGAADTSHETDTADTWWREHMPYQ
jgi:hypothetical protein